MAVAAAVDSDPTSPKGRVGLDNIPSSDPLLVFYYKESGVYVRGAITRENIPFTIGIQTSWQQDMMLKHGHKKAVSIDATFATNENKVRCYFCPCFTMLQNMRSTCDAGMNVTCVGFCNLHGLVYMLMLFLG